MSSFGDLKSSQWNTEYGMTGSTVAATLVIDGNSGWYETSSFKGQLSNVDVDETSGSFVITGRWNAAGGEGTFRFDQAGTDDKFTGGWTRDSGPGTPAIDSGPWTGKLSYAYEPWVSDATNSSREMHYCKTWCRDTTSTMTQHWCCWYPREARFVWCFTNFRPWGCCDHSGGRWWSRGGSGWSGGGGTHPKPSGGQDPCKTKPKENPAGNPIPAGVDMSGLTDPSFPP